ncbi:MAG: FAD-binding oxidoreductase [Chloroflexi bacterium]|nr:FAD-binding oxidoreductase [Chloroflexota bacterium]
MTLPESAEALPIKNLARLENFGHSLRSSAYLFAPQDASELARAFELADARNLSIGLRGAGRSYGDAALNSGQLVLDLQAMNRIQAWDPKSGVISVEPGVTIAQLWKHVLGDGWWPPVVPGTMFPTLGGCLAANIHGKNNWLAGTLGEHVKSFEALLPNGELVVCSPEKNKELFYAMIGSMGLLGIFTSITLQMKQIHSGDLSVSAWASGSFEGMLDGIDGSKTADYVVGWIDCIGLLGHAGRGQIHRADYLKMGEDPDPSQSLRIDHQELPDRFLKLLPKAWLPLLFRPATNNLGTALTNTAKYWHNRTLVHNKTHLQSLVAFNFLLDYVPNWEQAYLPGGLIQYQSFLPKATAGDGFRELIALCKRRGLPSYLGVLKRHRPDPFLLSHAVDGFSLALDFQVNDRRRGDLERLINELDEIVLQAGGRYYFAKDSTLNAAKVQRFLGDETVQKLRKFKAQTDPEQLLQTDLYRRCFVN